MSLISRYEHLPRRPRSDEARPLLEKIASQVKPIMTKRGWKVGTLAEFFPTNPSLLGLNTNSGQKINLRLRPPGSPDSFYDFDQLVLVMLHELTHNEIGPHNPSFYKLLGELEEEYYELKRKGYTGEGFNSTGHHLPGIKRSEYDGRRAGLLAAQKRLDTQLRMGKGGRLGGAGLGGSASGKSLREIVAEAAQRRIQDDKTCATDGHGGKEAQEEVKRAERESVGEDVLGADGTTGASGPTDRSRAEGLAGSDSSGAAGSGVAAGEGDGEDGSDSDPDIQFIGETFKGDPADRRAQASSQTRSPSHRPTTSHPPAPAPSTQFPLTPSAIPTAPSAPPRLHPPTKTPPPASAKASPSSEWTCPICTLLNPLHHLHCDACTTERPATVRTAALPAPATQTPMSAMGGSMFSDESGWYCAVCTAGPRSWEYWTCEVCESVRKFG